MRVTCDAHRKPAQPATRLRKAERLQVRRQPRRLDELLLSRAEVLEQHARVCQLGRADDRYGLSPLGRCFLKLLLELRRRPHLGTDALAPQLMHHARCEKLEIALP